MNNICSTPEAAAAHALHMCFFLWLEIQACVSSYSAQLGDIFSEVSAFSGDLMMGEEGRRRLVLGRYMLCVREAV